MSPPRREKRPAGHGAPLESLLDPAKSHGQGTSRGADQGVSRRVHASLEEDWPGVRLTSTSFDPWEYVQRNYPGVPVFLRVLRDQNVRLRQRIAELEDALEELADAHGRRLHELEQALLEQRDGGQP